MIKHEKSISHDRLNSCSYWRYFWHSFYLITTNLELLRQTIGIDMSKVAGYFSDNSVANQKTKSTLKTYNTKLSLNNTTSDNA